MKAEKYRDLTSEELCQAEIDTQADILRLKIRKGSGESPEQPLKIRAVRRDLARIQTVARERALKDAASAPHK